MAIDEASFRRAMGQFACGVTVVTTEHQGILFGMTVASFASLSLDPPMLLVCLETSVKTLEAIVQSGRFGVSILRDTQEAVSAQFASRTDDRFAGIAIRRGELGVPLLAESLATIECLLHKEVQAGDHSIVIGDVMHATLHEGQPLVYFRSAYWRLET
ncbi:MAG TPA: flavin reductase family protein [Thermoanaerobaculia bacterium]|nr:flavin reductase family protein [Thermoanaerobaculia bacterium]